MPLSELYNQIQKPNPVYPGLTFAPTERQLPNGGGIFTGVTTQKTPAVPTAPAVNPNYINPVTGGLYTPEEHAANTMKKLQGTGTRSDIPQFAGDQFNTAPQSAPQLQSTAAGLNNARNDIATGATDPYKAASQSGVAYSPAELSAIEKAYAGVYDPAINTALAKLDLKQKQDAAEITADREAKVAEQKFQYDLRLKGTPTAKESYEMGMGGSTGAGLFTITQLNKGASMAGMDIATFRGLHPNIKNYFINAPKTADTPSQFVKTVLDNAVAAVKSGDETKEQFASDMLQSNLPDEVKQYYLDQLPASNVEKVGWFQQIWEGITGTGQ